MEQESTKAAEKESTKAAGKGSSYGLAIMFIFITLISYVIWFSLIQNQPLSLHTETWGQFGDFFGGVSNPIIALLTLYWVMEAVKLQRDELKDTTLALQDTANTQSVSACITALTTQLKILQSEIDQLLSERSYYAEVEQAPSGMYKTLEGTLSVSGLLEKIAAANEQIIKRRQQREVLKQQINIYMEKIAPEIGAAEILNAMSKSRQ